MPETMIYSSEPGGYVRHRGRLSQVRIYLGKFFRMFVYQNDWKVLPMAAVISAIVAMVIQPSMYVTMDGTVFGAFALSCVSIWNGCFNSIQVVCRERGIIKREHRSGMHISSYVVAHMVYQAFLCLAQTALMTFVCIRLGVKFPAEGFITPWSFVDFAVTVFLVTYSSDMLGLFISGFVRNTTTAMTIMPFLLIFQLVFSGGFFTLPSWSQPLTDATISRYGLRSISALADYNELPSSMAWNTVAGMWNTELRRTVTVDDIVNVLQSDLFRRQLREFKTEEDVSLDEIVDMLVESGALDDFAGEEAELHATVGEIVSAIGVDKVRTYLQTETARTAYVADYDRTEANVVHCWIVLAAFAVGFAALATVALEFIDKDKR